MKKKKKRQRSIGIVILLLVITVLIVIGIHMLSFYPRKPVNVLDRAGQDAVEDYKTEIITINVQNGNNRIVGQMYKPIGTGLFPLLIYSHGFSVTRPEYSLEELAKHGIAAYRF